MDPADFLLVMAEVSAAFAGFASLIAVLGIRTPSGSRVFDLLRYWVMLEFSIAGVAFALLPFIPLLLGANETVTWRALSGLVAVFVVAHNLVLAYLYLRGDESVRAAATPGSVIPANVIYLALLATQLGNALGLLHSPAGWYAAGVVLVLVVATAHFVLFVAHALSHLRGSQ